MKTSDIIKLELGTVVYLINDAKIEGWQTKDSILNIHNVFI